MLNASIWLAKTVTSDYCSVLVANWASFALTIWDHSKQWMARWLLGQKSGSRPGSNVRRGISRAALVFAFAVLFGSLIGGPIELFGAILSLLPIIVSILFFVFVVVAIPHLTSEGFTPNAGRLVVDALISTLLTIISFGYFYYVHGIENTIDSGTIFWIDYYYFSAVTFSTLGYGDFRPCPETRIAAALQAIIGNLHLGIIVAATFLAATATPSTKKATGESDNHDGSGDKNEQ
ncbi:MAG: ion channel [Pseudomonadota bacterium]